MGLNVSEFNQMYEILSDPIACEMMGHLEKGRLAE